MTLLATAAVIATATGCLATGGRAPPAKLAKATCRTVFVTSNGFHTGIAIPGETAKGAGFEIGSAPWVEFGWGEDVAYRGERLTGRAAVKAALGGEGVLHVAPLRDRPDRLYANGVSAVAVSDEGVSTLTRELSAEVARDVAGRPLVAGPGKGEDAVFLKARTPYRAWRTCNVWTAEKLRQAGVSVPRAGSTFAPVLTGRLDRLPRCGDAAVDNAGSEAGADPETRGLVQR